MHLDWNNVLQVIASSKSQSASCPICLGEPTAPRMAKCGHIFCLACLIRYMHSEDASAPPPEKKARWKKCPICWDSVYITDTRPVRWYVGQESDAPREGGDVVLRLVKRKPGSTLAMPRESADTVAKGEDIPWYFAAEVMDYMRVMKGSGEYMVQQYDECLEAIERQQREDELMFGEDDEWTGRAIRMIREFKEKVKDIGNPPAQPQKPAIPEPETHDGPVIEFTDDDGSPTPQPHQDAEASSSTTAAPPQGDDSQASEQPISSQSHDAHVPRTLNEMRQRHLEKPQPSEYLFYQGLLHYYLSPLDIRILKTAFGTYSALPSSILPRVERISSGHIVDDDLRKRIKYLGHLPHGCEVAFLECGWRDVVRPEVLAEFRPLIERRRKRNDEKVAREEKERARIERAEEREIAALRSRRRPSIPGTDAFFTSSFQNASSPPLSNAQHSTSPHWASSAHQRPGFGSLASPSTSPSLSRAGNTTVWGTAAVAPASPDLHATLPHDDTFRHDADDGWLQGWEKDLLMEEEAAVLEGVREISLEGAEGGVSLGAAAGKNSGGKGAGGGGKKGKKGKKITLMSTGGARRGA